MKKMNEKPGHVRSREMAFYEKLHAHKFVPQQGTAREPAYWLLPMNGASQTITQIDLSLPTFIKVDLQVKFWPVFETLMLLFLNLKEWKPIKKVWKPISKPVANSKPQWKPTGRHFSLFEKYPLTRIMEPTDMPLELPPSASSSPQITMVSRFIDHKLSDRKAGSKGISVEEEENEEVEEEASKDGTKIQVDAELTQDIGWLLPIFLRAHAEPWRIFVKKNVCCWDSSAARLTRTTAYNFKQNAVSSCLVENTFIVVLVFGTSGLRTANIRELILRSAVFIVLIIDPHRIRVNHGFIFFYFKQIGMPPPTNDANVEANSRRPFGL
ncbi:hypothetical protein Tco_0869317, partial [Tanacetum coccineum]